MSNSLISDLLRKLASEPDRAPVDDAQAEALLHDLAGGFSQTNANLQALRRTMSEMYVDIIAGMGGPKDRRAISCAPGQVYSQNNEDGIIAEILARIGTDTKTFVEIAAGDGIENTTRLLIDLGWMLATWAGDDGARPVVRVEPWVGYPTPAELIDRYAAQSSRSVAAIDWYVVLACYKLGIILEGTFARACAGLADRQTGEELHAFAIALFSRALERMHR